eukprot:4576849-Pyramimonas_sp.AAC.1
MSSPTPPATRTPLARLRGHSLWSFRPPFFCSAPQQGASRASPMARRGFATGPGARATPLRLARRVDVGMANRSELA